MMWGEKCRGIVFCWISFERLEIILMYITLGMGREGAKGREGGKGREEKCHIKRLRITEKTIRIALMRV